MPGLAECIGDLALVEDLSRSSVLCHPGRFTAHMDPRNDARIVALGRTVSIDVLGTGQRAH